MKIQSHEANHSSTQSNKGQSNQTSINTLYQTLLGFVTQMFYKGFRQFPYLQSTAGAAELGNTRSQLFNESLGVPYSANGHHYSKTCLGGKPTTFIVMSRDIFYVRKLTSCAPSLSVTSVVKLKGAGLILRVYLGAFGINMLILQVGHCYSKKFLEASQQFLL